MPKPKSRKPEEALLDLLRERFSGSRKIAVLGVGSELRRDDFAGMAVARKLLALFEGRDEIGVFLGETAPENNTGAITRFLKSAETSHLLLVDAADMKLAAGEIRIIALGDEDGHSCSTHQLPIGILVKYFQNASGCGATILGIQPASTAFGQEMAPVIKRAVLKTVKLLAAALPR